MLDTVSSRFRIRKSFSHLRDVVDLPDLIEVQKVHSVISCKRI